MAEALTFKVGADTAAFQKGMKKAMGTLVGLGAAFVSTRAILDSFGAALDMSGKLNDLGKQVGETAGRVAILTRAFKNSGAGAEAAAPSIAKMQKVIQDSAVAGGAAEKTLNDLGLQYSDLAGKLPIDQMQIIAERIGSIEDPTKRANAAMDIFGSRNTKVIGLLSDFSGEMETAKKQLGSLPDILDKSAGKFDDVGDKVDDLKEKSSHLAAGFLSELLPAINKVLDALSGGDAAGLGKKLGGMLTASLDARIDALDLNIAAAERSIAKKKELGEAFAAFKGTEEPEVKNLAEMRSLLARLVAEKRAIEASQREAAAKAKPNPNAPGTAEKPPQKDDLAEAMGKGMAEVAEKEFEKTGKEILAEMTAAFGPIEHAGNKLNTAVDDLSRDFDRLSDPDQGKMSSMADYRDMMAKKKAGRPPATSITGAQYEGSFAGKFAPGTEENPMNKKMGLFGGIDAFKEANNLGEKKSPSDAMKDKAVDGQGIKDKARASNDRSGGLEGTLNQLLAEVKQMNTKLPQHVLS